MILWDSKSIIFSLSQHPSHVQLSFNPNSLSPSLFLSLARSLCIAHSLSCDRQHSVSYTHKLHSLCFAGTLWSNANAVCSRLRRGHDQVFLRRRRCEDKVHVINCAFKTPRSKATLPPSPSGRRRLLSHLKCWCQHQRTDICRPRL